MTTQTIQSVREELEKELKELNDIRNSKSMKGLISYSNQEDIQHKSNYLEGFNLGVSLAQKEFLDFLEDLLKEDIHKEPYQFLKYSILETKIKMVYKIEELKKSLGEKK